MIQIAGLIYAGGHARRLGGRSKAAIDIGGVPLLRRVYEAMSGCEPLLLSIGPREVMSPSPVPPERQLRDLDGRDLGPIGALAAAVEWLVEDSSADFLLTAAVDTPFLPTDFSQRAWESLADRHAAIAAYGEHRYPTHTLVDYTSLAEVDPFVNVNTEADLEALERRARL
jgi:molybdopterin-guanine dinucleotide biosynthesis protein A